jgi:hypothetical protein
LKYNIASSSGIEELLNNIPGKEGWEITYFRSPSDVELHFGSEPCSKLFLFSYCDIVSLKYLQ